MDFEVRAVHVEGNPEDGEFLVVTYPYGISDTEVAKRRVFIYNAIREALERENP